ncbi:MAG TPA: NUDIX domain-containing protein [Bacteroidales bacterium]|nr:NUDIX domain-containing protein [Bacteroidales bacterium]
MYKVHFEERFILISSEPDRLQKYGLFHSFNRTKEFYKVLSDFQADTNIPSINIYGPDIKHIWKLFRILFTEVNAAGGLVKHTSGRFLFIEKRGKLDLPKGHVDEGEEYEACALREVEEECGIQGHRIIKRLEPTWHTYSRKEITYLKKTEWFLMHYNGEMINRPAAEEGITGVDWLFPEEGSMIRERAWPSLLDVINNYVFTRS